MTEQWSKAEPVAIDWLAHLDKMGEKASPEFAWTQTSLAAIQCGTLQSDASLASAIEVFSLPGAHEEDLARARNIAACCQVHLHKNDDDIVKTAVEELEAAYRKLKVLLDELPGFKQFFLTNAIQRHRRVFAFLGAEAAVKRWNDELFNVRSYLNGTPAPLHPGIPHYDPAPGKESPRFERPSSSANSK